MEEQPLHDRIQWGWEMISTDPDNLGNDNNKQALQYQVSAFLCPSDYKDGLMLQAIYSRQLEVAVTNYKACSGSNWPGTTLSQRFRRCKDSPDFVNDPSTPDGTPGGPG